MGSSTPLFGRVEELGWLRRAAAQAHAGTSSAVLVHGEAGIGKTRLVSEAAAELGRDGYQVLWGRCVRFAAEVSSYLPIVQALGERVELDPTRPGTVIDRVRAAVSGLLEEGPLALVIDDLQWADLSSLDVLASLVAGFTEGQRLLVVGTYRDTDLGDAHALHGWLADVRRMPGVSSLPLGRLDRRDSEELVRSVLGDASATSVSEQAFARAQGNPYFTELLVRSVEPGAARLSELLPVDLREALLAAWHRLSAPTRELVQVLAAGGMPITDDMLQRVAAEVGIDAEKVLAAVVEAGDAGLTQVSPAGTVWFHHPLVAEALVATLLPTEATRLHTAYVAAWSAAPVTEAGRAAHLTLHLAAAGDASGALVWALHAAEEAERVQGYAEESHQLSRACDLWPGADPETQRQAGQQAALLLRATRAAHRAGDYPSALPLGQRAYQLTVTSGDPMLSCRVLNELNWLRMQHLIEFEMAPLLEAVDLSAIDPSSPEYARALAHVSWYEQWHALPQARDHALEALERARRCGSTEALVFALCVAANARSGEPEALALTDEALALARRAGLTAMVEYGAVVRANSLQSVGRAADAGPFLLDTYRDLKGSVAPHAAAGIAVYAAQQLLDFGEWRASRELLAEAMAARMAGYWTRTARLTMATLAARTGQPSAARQHLTRAEELVPRDSGGGAEAAHVAVAAEVLDAEGRHADAVALLTDEIADIARIDPVWADQLVVWGARSATQEVQRHPLQRRAALAAVDGLVEARSSVSPPIFHPSAPDDTLASAFRALHAAHRCGVADELGGDVEAWQVAAEASDVAGLVWQAAEARHRLGIALLAHRRPLHQVRAALREARRAAVELGDERLLRDVEATALQAHLDLADVATARPDPSSPPGLTAREQEVLRHLLTGRTYAEIAEALVISQKTVSVHVSNLLRKTGTSSRVELAALIQRSSPAAGPSAVAQQGNEQPRT